jgi:hypothetical protein
MRRNRLLSLLIIFTSGLSLAQTSSPTSSPPQSARQALIEMFMGKGENDFTKHLPETASQALIHKGDSQETSTILRISAIGRQMAGQGERLEVFDAGPVLLANQQNEHEKFEVMVEHDSLIGDENEIELSVHYYKDGQPQSLPVVPRLIFTLKREKEVWRLTELTVSAHIPLTDPDYLNGLRKQQDESNETAARNRITAIAMAERRYAVQHPDRGYTCTIATLFATEPGAPEEGGFSYDPGQGNDQWSGYQFVFSGCEGTPASRYRVSAVPIDTDTGTKMFCADESGTLKSLSGTRRSSCFSRGEVVQSGMYQDYSPN